MKFKFFSLLAFSYEEIFMVFGFVKEICITPADAEATYMAG